MQTKLHYLDLKEFLYKFFDVEFEPISIFSTIVQLIIIVWIVYQFYKRFQGTQAERVLRGLIFFIPIILLCYTFKLNIITKLIELSSTTILIGLIVIFAPEFRRVLMQLGGNVSLAEYFRHSDSKMNVAEAAEQILSALVNLQSSRTGALIVIEKTHVDRYYINPGFKLNASLSKELLITILNSKSPLHDGAVIIRGYSIVAASVILPMTENPKLDWQYGTRHRAAIGFSEVTDSLCLVVSEETGNLSSAYQGRLQHYPNSESLRKVIENYYTNLFRSEKKTTKIARYVLQTWRNIKKF